jgi:predicted HTH domain antitoxin
MKTLNFIPFPLLDESPRSLIRRLAIMNGYSTVSKFTGHIFGYSVVAQGNSLIQGNRYETFMAAQVGVNLQERIQDGFYPLVNKNSPGSDFLLGGLIVSRRLLRTRYFPACSECCDSDHFHYITDLCLCKYCPIHSRKLLFTCPSCNRKLRMRHQGRKNCSCGADWQSPACTEMECLPEKRLQLILEQQDQKKLDALLSAIRTFGIQKNKTYCATHIIFDAASCIVFDDTPRLEKLLRTIWSSLDITQAEILAIKFRKDYPGLAHLFEALPKKDLTTGSEPARRLLKPNSLRTLLGVTTKHWNAFIATYPKDDKNEYDGHDIVRLKQATAAFESKVREQRKRLEVDVIASCYSLEVTSKLLGLSPVECKILGDQKLLVPSTSIRTRPYYRKQDILEFQNSFIPTRNLASSLKKTYVEMIAAINRCEAVQPIVNRSGYPFLIRTADVEMVCSSASTIPKKTNSLKGQTKLRRCVTDKLKISTLDQAAAILGTHRNTVIYYRDIGLIRCSTRDTRIFPLDDVVSFYTKFATPRTLCKELNLPHNKLSGILQTHNILPISGKLTNGHSITVYDRRTFPKNLQTQLNPTHDTFGACLFNHQAVNLREAANMLGIKYSEMRRFAKEEIRPARSPLYRAYLKISDNEINSFKTMLANLTPLSHILHTYKLTHRGFFRRFIASGFVHLLKFNDQEWLIQDHVIKINSLMSTYCTLQEASEMLGVSSAYMSILVKTQNIALHSVPGYGYRHPLLKRKDVQTMLNCKKHSTRRLS